MIPTIANPPDNPGHREVTQKESAGLRNAAALSLLHVACSPAADALIADVQVRVEGVEGRKTSRRAKGRAKLTGALAAILGGVLEAELRHGRVVYRVTNATAFTGAPVGAWTFREVTNALAKLGLLVKHASTQLPMPVDGGLLFQGFAPRFQATPALAALAAHHGITAATVKTDFRKQYPTAAPKVTRPLRLVALPEFRRTKARRRALPIPAGDDVAAALAREVDAHNAFMSAHSFSGCVPPRFYRQFSADAGERPGWNYGGRWWSAGPDSIQTMPPGSRIAIEIDGSPVVEIDARASQFTILAGLAGVSIEGDPYALPDAPEIPREAIKALMVITLGNGVLPRRWPSERTRENPALAAYDPVELSARLAARYPFLLDLPGLLGVPRNRVVHRLQFLEATAITAAMRELRGAGVVSIPVHDSLILPASARAAGAAAMLAAYKAISGAAVQLTVKTV